MADSPDVLHRLEELSVCEHLLSKLKYAQAASRAALETEFGQIGITIPQFLALAAIEENADISSAELARMSYVSPQAMITIVARLQSAKLITRAPAAERRTIAHAAAHRQRHAAAQRRARARVRDRAVRPRRARTGRVRVSSCRRSIA